MAVCRLVIIKRNGEDLTEQLLAPGTEWKIGKSVSADIRVRIDGVEDEHGIIKVDKTGKVCVQNLSADKPLMINGKHFRNEHTVKNGDHLSIISRSFRFDIKEPVLKQVTANAPQLTSTPDQVSTKSLSLQRRISGIENYRSSPRPGRSRRSTPGTVGVASRNDTPVPSGSLYKSWRSSLSVNGSSLDKIQEGEEVVDEADNVQQCLFAEEQIKISDGASVKKPRRSTRRSSIRRSVAFGPALSPEYFDKSLPPNTPLKKGTMPPSVSFVADQLPNELEQIVEEEEAQTSYSELFSTPGKRKSPTPNKAKESKTKSPKPMGTKERREAAAAKKGTSPAKETIKIRKSYGGVPKKGTKQKRSSLPASMKQITAVGLIGGEDSTDGAVFGKPKPKEAMHTPKIKKKILKAESTKKLGPVKDQPVSNRSFVVEGSKEKSSNNRRSLPASVLMKGVNDTSLVPYVPAFYPAEDVSTLPQEESLEVSTETEEESEVKLSLPTPLKKSIQGGVPLKQTKPKLWTPLRADLEKGVVLRKLHQALPTPVRMAIASNPVLRATKKALATPLRKEIEGKPKLHATKKMMATPLRKEIEGKPKLRATKKTMATPLRKEIEGKPKLQATRKAMATPIRKEIEGQPKLRATKKTMATPLRKEIEGKPKLRATRKAMATPVRKEIEAKPKLRVTKKKMATPLRRDIESKPKLKAVMKSLPTPLKMDIKKTWNLRKTKPRMATPLQQSIKQKPTLRKLMKSLPTPLRQEIESQPTLKETKKMLPLAVREEILQHPPLKPTKKRMATPLRQAIENAPPLKATKKNEDKPLTERRAPKRRQSRSEDELPPKKKTKATVTKSPSVEYTGLQQLFKETSKTRHGTPQGDAIYQGIQRMFHTPKGKKDLSPDFEGLVDLFNTPIVPTSMISKKVKFLSPVAVSAKKSTRSKAAVLSGNTTMVLSVPKLDSESVENVRQTRSKAPLAPFVLADPSPVKEPNKKASQKRRVKESAVTSSIPESDDTTVATPATRSRRSSSRRAVPVSEVAAPVAVKKKVTTKKKTEAETKEQSEVVVTRRQTRASKPVKEPAVSPVRKTRQSKNKQEEVSTVEVNNKGKVKVTAESNNNVSPTVRRTRRSQVTQQEDITVEVETNTRKRKRPAKDTVESVSPVVRKTRSRVTKQEIATVEVPIATKKRKTSQKVAKSDAKKVGVSAVVRRTRSQMIQEESVSTSTETKKVTVTQRKVQDMKESEVDDAAGPVVRRTRQNPIIKVIVPVKTTVMSEILESQEQNAVRRSSRRRK